MSKIFMIALSLTLVSCGTFRPMGDSRVAEATGGVRTMFSNACWIIAGCIEKSIIKAKTDCSSENKKYEYVSHNFFLGTSNVLYRCK